MDIFTSVFNNHVNDAHNKAKAAFIEQYGQDSWREHMQGYEDNGIMAMFDVPPNEYTSFYAEHVQAFVNKEELKHVPITSVLVTFEIPTRFRPDSLPQSKDEFVSELTSILVNSMKNSQFGVPVNLKFTFPEA